MYLQLKWCVNFSLSLLFLLLPPLSLLFLLPLTTHTNTVPPSITVPPTQPAAILDSIHTLQCRVTGRPTPSIQWALPDGTEPVDITDNPINIDSIPYSFNRISGELRISRVKAADAGTYNCTATNIVGNTRLQVQVEVKGESNWVLQTHSQAGSGMILVKYFRSAVPLALTVLLVSHDKLDGGGRVASFPGPVRLSLAVWISAQISYCKWRTHRTWERSWGGGGGGGVQSYSACLQTYSG